MTSLVGRVYQFDPNLEHWQQYVDRLGHFLDANGITDEGKKRSVFLTVIGPAAYRLLISLITPAKPGEKGYDDLVKTLTEHYDPAPSEIVQRYKFHTRISHGDCSEHGDCEEECRRVASRAAYSTQSM